MRNAAGISHPDLFGRMFDPAGDGHKKCHRQAEAFFMVPREGIEPPTCGIEAHCSNPLSYRGRYQIALYSFIGVLTKLALWAKEQRPGGWS